MQICNDGFQKTTLALRRPKAVVRPGRWSFLEAVITNTFLYKEIDMYTVDNYDVIVIEMCIRDSIKCVLPRPDGP